MTPLSIRRKIPSDIFDSSDATLHTNIIFTQSTVQTTCLTEIQTTCILLFRWGTLANGGHCGFTSSAREVEGELLLSTSSRLRRPPPEADRRGRMRLSSRRRRRHRSNYPLTRRAITASCRRRREGGGWLTGGEAK